VWQQISSQPSIPFSKPEWAGLLKAR